MSPLLLSQLSVYEYSSCAQCFFRFLRDTSFCFLVRYIDTTCKLQCYIFTNKTSYLFQTQQTCYLKLLQCSHFHTCECLIVSQSVYLLLTSWPRDSVLSSSAEGAFIPLHTSEPKLSLFSYSEWLINLNILNKLRPNTNRILVNSIEHQGWGVKVTFSTERWSACLLIE